jgi:dihydroorotate dehydrogenase
VGQALRYIGAGASLIQLYTGLVYEGPLLVKRLNVGIGRAVSRAGCRSIAELVGRGAHEISQLESVAV